MGWWRDRRGYGQLRLPLNRRAARRGTWLGRDLRARRRELLRSFWRPLGAIVAAFVAGSAPAVLFLYAHARLQGLVIGALLGAGTVGLVFLLALVDGTLLARIGRWHETNVGDDLRLAPGVYGVLSNVPFHRFDVDHVVLAPTGCWAVEVKSLLGRREPLDRTWGLPAKIEHADRGAREVRDFLRRAGIDIPVKPLLVLAGPGAPNLPGTGVVRDGVRVFAYRDSRAWLPPFAATGAVDLPSARRAADALLELTNPRPGCDPQHHTRPGSHPPPAPAPGRLPTAATRPGRTRSRAGQ